MPLTESQQRLLGNLASWCSVCERCTADVEARLRKSDVDAAAAATIIERLKAENFVNDERYARAFVRDKAALQGWGPMKIRQHLAQKHIDSGTITEALVAYGDTAFDESLREFLVHRSAQLRSVDPRQRTQKLLRAALSRGFGYDESLRILRCIGTDDDTDTYNI